MFQNKIVSIRSVNSFLAIVSQNRNSPAVFIAHREVAYDVLVFYVLPYHEAASLRRLSGLHVELKSCLKCSFFDEGVMRCHGFCPSWQYFFWCRSCNWIFYFTIIISWLWHWFERFRQYKYILLLSFLFECKFTFLYGFAVQIYQNGFLCFCFKPNQIYTLLKQLQ